MGPHGAIKRIVSHRMPQILCTKHPAIIPPNNITTRHQLLPQQALLSTTHVAAMPSYIVTCKEDATPDQVEIAKQHAIDQGGKIGHEYSLIKGFSVVFDEDAVQTLESHEHIKSVEPDSVVHTM